MIIRKRKTKRNVKKIELKEVSQLNTTAQKAKAKSEMKHRRQE